MKRHILAIAGVLLAAAVTARAEDEPPGAPGSEAARMRTLNEIEPRKPILSIPYAITNPGAYYLAAPVKAEAGRDGIEIACSDVSVDLGGFSMNGATDAWNAIEVTVPATNVVIRNGMIRGWGAFGVHATNAVDAVLLDLKTVNNGAGGLYVGANAFVQRCSAYGNGFTAPPTMPPSSDGIQCGPYSTVLDCKSRGNRGAGIHTYNHTRVTGCTATESAEADGIHAEDYCTVRDCVAAANRMHGIKVGSLCRVTENTCAQNGLTNGAGIFVIGKNSLIEKNNVCHNYTGIEIQGGMGDPGNLLIHNTISKNTNSFFIGAGNYVGLYDEMVPGSVGTTNPWVNFNIR